MTYSRDRFKPGDKVRCVLVIEGEVEATPYLGDLIGLRVGSGRYRTVRLSDITDVEWQYPKPEGWPAQVGDVWEIDKGSSGTIAFCFDSGGERRWQYVDGSQSRVAKEWENRTHPEWKWKLISRRGM